MSAAGWIGVDLDGTLAHDGATGNPDWKIGAPVPAMLARVRKWIADGIEVRIVTARACFADEIPHVQAWLDNLDLGHLAITNAKDFAMIQLWDDRAVQVIPNTGLRADGLEL